jgi:hypothetical protein
MPTKGKRRKLSDIIYLKNILDPVLCNRLKVWKPFLGRHQLCDLTTLTLQLTTLKDSLGITVSVLHFGDAHLKPDEIRLGKSIFFVVFFSPSSRLSA